MHDCKGFSKINAVPIEVTIATTKYFVNTSKYFVSPPFSMSCYFTKIFSHLLIFAAVCNLCVYKLKGWDPGKTYLFKVNTRKRNT